MGIMCKPSTQHNPQSWPCMGISDLYLFREVGPISYILSLSINFPLQTSRNCPTLRLASLVHLTLAPIYMWAWLCFDKPDRYQKPTSSWSGPLIDLVTTKMQDIHGKACMTHGPACIACIGRLYMYILNWGLYAANELQFHWCRPMV